MKDVQATGEASGPQKIAFFFSKTSKHTVFFCCGSFLPTWIRTQIQPTKTNADPDPQRYSNQYISSLFPCFVGHFCPPPHRCGSGSSQQNQWGSGSTTLAPTLPPPHSYHSQYVRSLLFRVSVSLSNLYRK